MNCCDSKHYIKFLNGVAIIPTWQLFEIEKCWKKNARTKCNVICPKDNPCKEHRLLNVFTFFSHYIRDRNTYRNDIVSKIRIRENCEHKGCQNRWGFEIEETKYLTEPGTRAKYLWLFFKNILKHTWLLVKSTCFLFCVTCF